MCYVSAAAITERRLFVIYSLWIAKNKDEFN